MKNTEVSISTLSTIAKPQKWAMAVRRWTQSSIDCYNRGCVCNGCFYQKVMSTPCMMKTTVLELVKLYGKPDENAVKNTIENITKKQIIELYIEKEMSLRDIYRILKVDRYEFMELLEKFGIKERKKPTRSKKG